MLIECMTELVPGQPAIRALLCVEQCGPMEDSVTGLLYYVLSIIKEAERFGGKAIALPPVNTALFVPSQKLPAIQVVLSFPGIKKGLEFQDFLRTFPSTPPLL